MADFPQNKTLDAQEIRRRMIRYFSQNGEDCFLWTLLDFPENGVFIDVGAFDGKYLSNSFSFAENGWEVICVEPLKQYAELCAKNQPNSICVNAACVASDEVRTITFASEPLGIYSRLTVQEGALDQLQDFYEKRGDHLDNFEMIEVTATTVWALAQQHIPGKVVDVLSVDVEGAEIDVFKGAQLELLKPRLVCAEANSDAERTTLDDYLGQYGYKYLRTMGVNHFYSAEPALIQKAKAIAIRCAIERQAHPMGIRYTIPSTLSGHIIDEVGQKAQQKLRKSVQESHKQIGLAERRNEQAIAFLNRISGSSGEPAKTFSNALENIRLRLATGQQQQQQLKQTVRRLEQSLKGATQSARLDTLEWQTFYDSHLSVKAPGWLRKFFAAAPARTTLADSMALLDKGMGRPQRLLPEKTELCVGGFMRTPELVSALRQRCPALSADNSIAHHVNDLLLIKTSLRLGIPTCVVLHPPHEAVSALHKKDGEPVQECAERWVSFHTELLALADMLQFVTGDDMRHNMNAVVDHLLGQIHRKPSGQNADAGKEPVKPAASETAIPEALLQKANALYETLLGSGRVIAPARPKSFSSL